MLFSLARVAIKAVLVAGLSFGVALPITVFSAEPAFANNGNGKGGGSSNRNNGNGNGSSGGNSSASRSNGNNGNVNGNSGGNGNSALARELGGLNAAQASQSALASASANSLPGKLYTYQQARRHLVERVNEQNVAFATYSHLAGMTEAQAVAAYPNGGHARALSDAAHSYNALQAQAEAAQSVSDASLMAVSGGRALSNNAMTELHRMLGL